MNLSDERARLVEAALGKAPADLVIRGGTLVNVHTREIYPADVVIQGKRIAAVVEAGSPAGAESEVIRADGMVLVPGFIDPHIHIESSAVTVKEYARVVVPRGVTTVAEDPHEIANVLGIPGFELFFAEAKALPLRLLLRVPGKVPGISADLETSGGEITLDQTRELLAREAAVCLAGDINPNLLIRGERAQLEKIAFTQSLRKTVSGQSPGLQGSALNAFIAAGPEDSHVSENAAEVLDIIRHGLRALITHREDFFRIEDYRELAELIHAGQLDTRMLCFCSDDVSPHLLLEQGAIDARVRLAIRYGMDPVTAIQMATINVADLLRLDRDLGSISPGKIADIAILSDLEKVTVDRVLFEGKLAAQDGRLVQEPPPFEYPDWAKNTIHIQRPVDPADIPIRVDESQAEVSARVIQMGMPKEERVIRLPVRSGSVLPDPEQDVLSVAVLDRHKSSGSIGRGFVTGTGLRGGAVASSVSHDAHNVFTIGADFESMAAAANRLAAIGGGHVAAKAGRVIAEIRLPIAGLISEEPVEVMAEQFERFERLLCEELAVRTPHLLYFIDFLCLPNIPHLGITDQGLINTDTMEIISPVL